MRLSQLAVFAKILLFVSILTEGASQAATFQGSALCGEKNNSDQPPFADARNMTVMVFLADPAPQHGMPSIAHAHASGSGVWVGKKGYVATCQHVVASWHGAFKIGFSRNAYVAEGGANITVGASVHFWDADLVASDPDSDVVILKAHVSPADAEPSDVVTGSLVAGERVITPQIQVAPKGASLRTDYPVPGEVLLLSGYPIGQKTLILQIGSATGVNFPEDSMNYTASGLRIFLSLVSNPGNSGGPILDAQGRVVGLLEANLTSPIRDEEGRQLYSPTVKYEATGKLAKDPSGQFLYGISPLRQNSGISVAVPSRAISELAKNNKINLECGVGTNLSHDWVQGQHLVSA
jgi:S1-C subfamily serine protease